MLYSYNSSPQICFTITLHRLKYAIQLYYINTLIHNVTKEIRLRLEIENSKFLYIMKLPIDVQFKMRLENLYLFVESQIESDLICLTLQMI